MQAKPDDNYNSDTMNDMEYRAFREFLEDACGIVLGENKQYLVSSRMRRVIGEFHLGSISELISEIKSGRNSTLKDRIIESMTTNETSWFRDSQPFDTLKQYMLPELLKRKPNRLRIWSAACSSGQEPYSIAIALHEFSISNPGALPKDIEIVATDISPEILNAAQTGIYDEMNIVRGMSDQRRRQYFQQVDGGWKVNDMLREKIRFRQLNLLQSYALFGSFDIIFCRNVLIYFSRERKADIVNRMGATLNPDGFLLLGGSESMSRISDKYKMSKVGGTVLYQLLENERYRFS